MYNSYSNYNNYSATNALVLGIIVVLVIIGIAINVLIWMKIFSKTGHGSFMGCLMLVPFADFILLLVLAFSEWPIEAELKRLRAIKSKE